MGWIQVTASCPLCICTGVKNSITEHRTQSRVLEAALLVPRRVCSIVSCVLFESPLKAELLVFGQAFSWCLLPSPCSADCSESIAPSLVCYYPLFLNRKLREGESKGKHIHEIWALGVARWSALFGLVPLLLRYSPFLGKCLGVKILCPYS